MSKTAINLLEFSIWNIQSHYNQSIWQRLMFMWRLRGNKVPYWSDAVLVEVALRDMKQTLNILKKAI